MQFRRFFFATLGGTVLSAVVGIGMAYGGCSVWALVMQQLLNAAVNTAILWVTVGWKPKWMFSFRRLAGLISFGWKLLVSALLDTVYNKLYQLVVGVVYSSADLAYYNKADQLPVLVVENINSSIDSVLLPVLSGCGGGKTKEQIFTKTIHDFEGYTVENLDEQEDTNFIVYAKGVKEITMTDRRNVLIAADEAEMTYTFNKADETLTNIQSGDVFYADASAKNPPRCDCEGQER